MTETRSYEDHGYKDARHLSNDEAAKYLELLDKVSESDFHKEVARRSGHCVLPKPEEDSSAPDSG